MAKRRVPKKAKTRLVIFGTASIVAIFFLCFSLISNTYSIITLTKEKRHLENFYVELQEQSKSLKVDIEKLSDENYLANYAREHYGYSKPHEYIIQFDDEDGEYILKLDDEKIKNSLDKEINKNYIIIALSILMLFIFIYILTKGKKRKK